MRKFNLSDADMLRAAQRAQREHAATRPATVAEVVEIAKRYRLEQEIILNRAVAIEVEPVRQTYNAADQRAESIRRKLARDEAARLRQIAHNRGMTAEAWERIQSDPVAAWEETARQLKSRVDYYTGLVKRRIAAIH
jgi:hypothetical protein